LAADSFDIIYYALEADNTKIVPMLATGGTDADHPVYTSNIAITGGKYSKWLAANDKGGAKAYTSTVTGESFLLFTSTEDVEGQYDFTGFQFDVDAAVGYGNLEITQYQYGGEGVYIPIIQSSAHADGLFSVGCTIFPAGHFAGFLDANDSKSAKISMYDVAEVGGVLTFEPYISDSGFAGYAFDVAATYDDNVFLTESSQGYACLSTTSGGRIDVEATDAYFIGGTEVRIYDSVSQLYLSLSHAGLGYYAAIENPAGSHLRIKTAQGTYLDLHGGVIRLRDATETRIYDSTNAAYIKVAHNGADAEIGATGVNLYAYSVGGLRIGNDKSSSYYVGITHNHGNAAIAGVGGTALDITGPTCVRVRDQQLRITDSDADSYFSMQYSGNNALISNTGGETWIKSNAMKVFYTASSSSYVQLWHNSVDGVIQTNVGGLFVDLSETDEDFRFNGNSFIVEATGDQSKYIKIENDGTNGSIYAVGGYLRIRNGSNLKFNSAVYTFYSGDGVDQDQKMTITHDDKGCNILVSEAPIRINGAALEQNNPGVYLGTTSLIIASQDVGNNTGALKYNASINKLQVYTGMGGGWKTVAWES
jgi:hypothetical protein